LVIGDMTQFWMPAAVEMTVKLYTVTDIK
jgi:hypothetical protein